MKSKILLRIAIFLLVIAIFSCDNMKLQSQNKKTTDNKDKKVLVVYYSRSGNTRAVAEHIQKTIGSDIFEIKPLRVYPEDYRGTTDAAKEEKDANARPTIQSCPANIEQYDIVFLCYPNWCATMPMFFFTLLENNDFSSKTIIPVCTHEGSKMGTSVDDIKKLCPKSKVLDGIAIRGSESRTSQDEVNKYLLSIGMLK